jgi:hypothetical protein
VSARFPASSAAARMDADFRARWADRDAISPAARATLREILGRFEADGGPITVASLRDPAPVAELDARDLVHALDGRIVLAYPWSATPTAFVTVLSGSRERWACCAIDALGVAPMLGEAVTVRSRCHHCAAPFELSVAPDGPLIDDGLMAWVGERADLRGKACTAL